MRHCKVKQTLQDANTLHQYDMDQEKEQTKTLQFFAQSVVGDALK